MPPYLLKKIARLFLSSLLIALLGITRTASSPVWNVCPTDANYTANSPFHTNLNLLLSSLSSNAPPTRFSNDTKGQSPDQAYGLALCEDDISPHDCQSCLTTAINDTYQLCPQGKRYAVWYPSCFLRYSNESFFSSTDTSPVAYLWNSANASDPTSFDQLLGNLMDNLTMESAYRSGGRMFAVREADYTSFQKLYGMVWCTRDMSDDACYGCLQARVGNIPSCCSGRQGGRVIGWSCYLRFEVYLFYNLSYNDDQDLSMPPSLSTSPSPATGNTSTSAPEAASTGASNGKNSDTGKIILFIAIPVVVALVLFSVICICFRRKKKLIVSINGRAPEGRDMHEIREVDLLFDLGTLRAATDNFSDANKLGEGGFGPVYKGLLSNGEEIAVKRLSRSSRQGLVELRNEVVFVARLQHRNLVRLLGFCLEEEEKMVVYEYLPNTSLDKILFDPTQRQRLHWGSRFKIIEGIARGLLYLHEDSRLRIVHRDLKASNILLDRDMNPKISDFGLAKLFHVEETHGNTSRIAGTYGYMAPEYAMHGLFSTKSDVFGFGVLALEIVTGRRNSGFRGAGNVVDLLGHVWHHWHEGRALQLRDPSLGHHYLAEEVLRCIHIGLLCVQEDPSERPSMASIVLMLSSFSVTLLAPSRPAFFTPGSVTSESDSLTRDTNLDLPQTDHPNGSLLKFRSNSKNDLSISEMDPR